MADDRVIFSIEAENAQLKAALAETQAELDKVKTTAEKVDDSGLGFKKSLSAVKSWIASVTSAIGVATTFYLVGQKINETLTSAFTSGTEKAQDFVDALDIANSEQALGVLQKEINKTAALLDDAIKRSEKGLLGDVGATADVKGFQQQLTRLRQEEETLLKSTNGKRLRLDERAANARADAQKKADDESAARLEEAQLTEEQRSEQARQERTQRALDDANALADATLSAEDKIARKRFDAQERARRLMLQAQTEQDRVAARALFDAANLSATYELDKIEDERSKKRIETEKKAADEFMRIVEERQRRLLDQIRQANSQFETGLSDRLNGTVSAIAADVRRILTLPSSSSDRAIGEEVIY